MGEIGEEYQSPTWELGFCHLPAETLLQTPEARRIAACKSQA